MRDHRKMLVFRIADELTLSIYRATRAFPPDELYGMVSQLRRAALSVGANIVEGATRSSDRDFCRFLIQAYGSARELEYEISLASRLGYLESAEHQALESRSSQLCKTLRAFILKLRAAPSTTRSGS